MNINIDADEVKQHIVKAILDSTIGVELKKAIESLPTRKVSNDWNAKTIFEDVFDRVVKEEVGRIALSFIQDRRDVIRAVLQEHLTDEIVKQVASKIICNAFELQ